MTEIAMSYNPAEAEPRWYARWLADGVFHVEADAPGQPYTIVIPPPNITGVLHMGHALNITIQDMLIRRARMRARKVLWIPGTDHAGIATQNVVERQLRGEGLDREQLGREAFVERVWAWKSQYGHTITNQLKRLGAACDWDRERFTLDACLSRAVTEVFVRLYNKGLIYRAPYIINWCPRCGTALSDEESEHKTLEGKLYHIRYRLKRGRASSGAVVATTRPETLLGDTAVAVNPRDSRYRHLHGKTLILPVLNRELPVITDDLVDPQFGTGAVKVTPAHDPNDYEMGKRHQLDSINVMNENGTMNEAAGSYTGLDRFECRQKLVDDLEAAGMLEKVEPHTHAVGHCYRCHTVVEPRVSTQWFVRMKPLAEPALEALAAGRLRFIPERWNKVYIEWLENIRDWCISRQIWWGHRIPVFTCAHCRHEWAAVATPGACPACQNTEWTQDADVLDTWFSSWLWPFSVFGWPDNTPELRVFYPTQTLCTASEIIFFWVARMVMAGLEFMGEVPFSEVYIHGTVRDDQGRKMSKSLGNSIDPLDIIEKYSADALRFSLMMLTATGQDVYISNEKFEIGRNFGTKIWNAARYLLMQTPVLPDRFAEPIFESEHLSWDDRHLIARLNQTIETCDAEIDRFRCNEAAKALYDFFWKQYCDWYVEYSKSILYGPPGLRRDQVLRIMHYVFCRALRLLHPIMPFLTEEVWHLMGYQALSSTIQTAPWPERVDEVELEAWGITAAAVRYVDAKHDFIRVARILMNDYSLLPKPNITFMVRPMERALEDAARADTASLTALLRVGSVVVCDQEPAGPLPSSLSQLGTVYMPIRGLIQFDAETARISAQLDKHKSELQRIAKKLENEKFLAKAPTDVVAREESRKKELLDKISKLHRLLAVMNEAQAGQ